MAKDRAAMGDKEVVISEKAQQNDIDLNAKVEHPDKELAEPQPSGTETEAAGNLDIKIDPPAAVKSQAQVLAGRYGELYPNNAVFYVTSDMQVFLDGDYNMALLHQKTLKQGELETVKF